MTIQRIGTSKGMKDVLGAKVIPIISFAVVHTASFIFTV
jgi:hypothetical protein